MDSTSEQGEMSGQDEMPDGRRRFIAQCTTCHITLYTASSSCLATFRRAENSHIPYIWNGSSALQFPIIDTNGIEHMIKLSGARGRRAIERWRSRFLSRVLDPGPLPPLIPQVEPGAANSPQFRWADNFHLLDAYFNVRIAVPNPEIVRFQDTSEVWDDVLFGNHNRTVSVANWRRRVIRKRLGMIFKVFFLSTPIRGAEVDEEDARVLETAILDYLPTQGNTLPLQEHMFRLQQAVSSQTRNFNERRNFSGADFPDLLLSIVTSGRHVEVADAFNELQWEERNYVDSEINQNDPNFEEIAAGELAELARELVCRELENQNQASEDNPAGCLYRAWRVFCHSYLLMDLRAFTSKVMASTVMRYRLVGHAELTRGRRNNTRGDDS
ncbi:hypothetical protein F4861DRAFT_536437 [Xylaria intraflava]|nr:hypothetical protein F4861DRAFT_536437 [Xylaria intraflava]